MLFLSIVAQLNLGGMLIRFVPLAGWATRRLISYTYLTSTLAAGIVAVVFLLGINFWSPSLNALVHNGWLGAAFVLGTMIWCVFALQDSALTALRQAVWVPVENALFAVVKIVLLVLFAATLTQYGIFASWTIPVLVSLLPVNFLIFRYFIPQHIGVNAERAQPIIRPQLVKYIGGNYIGSLFFQASTTLLPLIVINRLGATMNAYFYLPWTITTSLQMVALNMSTSFTVEATREREQLRSYGARVLLHNLRLLVPLVIGVVVAAPYILGLFGANYAVAGTDILRLLALSTISYSFVSLYVGLERVQNRVQRIAVVQGVRCLTLLALSYLLLPTLGIVAIGWVWLVTETTVGGYLLLTQLRPFLHIRRHPASGDDLPVSSPS
jgi:O-antigen/teichoic acid export membrane protein